MSRLVVIALHAAELPDPASPSIIAFGGALGGVVAGSVARIRRLPPDRVARMTMDGTWLGAVCGFLCYCATPLR